MYRRTDSNQITLFENNMDFRVKLNSENRWVKLAEIMPWERIEEYYASKMCEDNGRDGISSRIAFGSIYAKEVMQVTDVGILEAIIENAYLQYFLGLQDYHGEPLFDSSMMVHFRRRFTKEFIAKVNDFVCTGKWSDNDDISPDDLTPPDDENGIKNEGRLTLDATVAPADIRYPNDIKLIRECRQYCEKIIDVLWEFAPRSGHKTPYHRSNADRNFNHYIFNRKPSKAKTKSTLKKQLTYLEMALQAVLWENFNECTTLQQSVADYFRRFGHYPEVVLCDKIYHTKENKKFCKKFKIRLGGIAETRKNISEFEKVLSRDDYRKRNEIEGVNGNLKRKYGLDLISSWTRHNAEIEAALNILDLNLQRRLKALFAFLFGWLFSWKRDGGGLVFQ